VSSAILYVAIVAIWIGVLVPRWLKHENSSSGLRRLSRHFGAHAADEEPGRADFDQESARAGFDPDGRPRYTSFVPAETPGQATPEVTPEGAAGSQAHAVAAHKHVPASYSQSQSHYGEKVSPAASGNNKSMTELYEAQTPRPEARPASGPAPQSAPRPASGPAPQSAPRPAASSYEEIPSYGWSADEVARQERLGHQAGPGAGAHARDAAPPHGAEPHHATPHDAEPHDDGVQADNRVPAPRGPHHDDLDDAERRAQIVRGRRRMLWLLLVLTAVGVGLAYLRLAAWWVMIPPTVLLAGYLLLLREAAHADAEARARHDLAHTRGEAPAKAGAPAGAGARAGAGTRAGAGAATEAAAAGTEAEIPVEETGPRADVIDLSEHVNDQLYDQYADAKLRAVGD
jgi:hypothetical protein